MFKLGITGTREGMNEKQFDEVARYMKKVFVPGAEFHHGDCIGVDVEAADIAKRLGYIVHAHPSYLKTRGYYEHNDVIYKERHPLKRNMTIVNSVLQMISVPRLDKEELRSGTWHATRYARKKDKVFMLAWPTLEAEYKQTLF